LWAQFTTDYDYGDDILNKKKTWTMLNPEQQGQLSKKNSLFSDEPRSKLTGHSPENFRPKRRNHEFLRKRTYALSGLQRKPTQQADGEFF